MCIVIFIYLSIPDRSATPELAIDRDIMLLAASCAATCFSRPLLHSHVAARATIFASESPEFGKFGACSPALKHTRRCTRAPTQPVLMAVPHNELSPGCAPLGVLCGGLSEDALEDIADAVESVFENPDEEGNMHAPHIPIVPLAQGDMRLRLRDVLAQLSERDSVVPSEPMLLRTPLILISGFSPVQTSLAVRRIRSLGLLPGDLQPEKSGMRWPWAKEDSRDAEPRLVAPMFAAAVPKSLDKPMRALCDELEGDHAENALKTPPPRHPSQ